MEECVVFVYFCFFFCLRLLPHFIHSLRVTFKPKRPVSLFMNMLICMRRSFSFSHTLLGFAFVPLFSPLASKRSFWLGFIGVVFLIIIVIILSLCQLYSTVLKNYIWCRVLYCNVSLFNKKLLNIMFSSWFLLFCLFIFMEVRSTAMSSKVIC